VHARQRVGAALAWLAAGRRKALEARAKAAPPVVLGVARHGDRHASRDVFGAEVTQDGVAVERRHHLAPPENGSPERVAGPGLL